MSPPGCRCAGQDFPVSAGREGSLLASFCARSRGGIRGGESPVAIVWPCPLPVDAYVAAGRKVEVPRPACPSCGESLVFWSGYWRHVRAGGLAGGRCPKIFVPRVRCGPCRVSHALLPAFVLAWRLDVAETVGAGIAEGAGGGCGVRPAAARRAVPRTTARGRRRRGGRRARGAGRRVAALGRGMG